MVRRIRALVVSSLFLVVPATIVIILISGAGEPERAEPVDNIPPPAPPSREEILFAGYSDHIRHEFDSLKTVGAAMTIVYKGEVVLTETLGKRNVKGDEPIDEHTVFRLASVSKGFAGVLAVRLEEERRLKLDDCVADRYPGFKLKDPESTSDMKIVNLLSHTTGLVPHAYDNLVEEGKELPYIVSKLDEVDIAGPPGAYYGYQNVMFSLIDPIAERATGRSYPELLKREIFDPLGMEDASAGRIDTSINHNVAFPHLKSGSKYYAVKLHEGYYNVLPAAGVNASISDMGKWLQALLGNNRKILSDDLLEKISTPVIYTPLKRQYTRQWEPFKDRYYSLGWRIYDYKGKRIMYHGGYVRGYRAEIAYCPEAEVGIAFLQNSPNGMASKVVPKFFDEFFALTGSGDEVAEK